MPKLSVSQAWDETVAFVTRETRLLVPLALALLFLPSVITSLAAPGGRADMNDSPLNLGLFFLELVVGLVGQIAIARLALGHREPLGTIIGHAARRTPALLGAAFVVMFPLAMAFGATIGGAGSITRQGSSANPVAAMLLLLAITLLLVALVIVLARFLLTTAAAAVEPGGPLRLLRRAFELTRGHALRLLGTALLFLIGGGVAVVAVTSVVGLGATLVLGKPEAWSVAALVIAVTAAGAQAVLGTLFTVCFARLYAQRIAGAEVPSNGI